MEETRRLEHADVVLLGAVLGLVSESDRVEEAVEGLRPRCLAIGISPGELEGLQAVVRDEVDEDVEPAVDAVDEAYAHHLSRFGEVRLPPPAFLRAVELGVEREIPLHPLDLHEEAFTEAYTDNVGAIDLMRISRRERKLSSRGIDASTAREFARLWDESLLKVGGLRRVEELREEHMASKVRELCRDGGRVLAVVGSARRPGIEAQLWPETAEDGGWLPF